MELSARQRRFLDRVIATIEAEPINTPDTVDIARALGTPIQAVTEIVRIGVQEGEILKVGDKLLYTPKQISAIQDQVRAMPSPYSPKQLREALATTRKYADGLLYYLDETGFTEPTEDGRVVTDSE